MSGTAISDNLIESCAQLFSTNYGNGVKVQTPSRDSQNPVSHICFAFLLLLNCFLGQSVKMTGSKLRSQCVSIPEKAVLVTCFQHKRLIGHAFASVWEFDEGMSMCIHAV